MSVPNNVLQIQGQTSVSADNLNSFLQGAATASTLRSFIGVAGMVVYLQGLSVQDDGGQGTFFWKSIVTEADDGRNYIIPLAANGGGWVRFGPELVLPVPAITGVLSAVTDTNAKAVLTSIISALTSLGLVTNGTT